MFSDLSKIFEQANTKVNQLHEVYEVLISKVVTANELLKLSGINVNEVDRSHVVVTGFGITLISHHAIRLINDEPFIVFRFSTDINCADYYSIRFNGDVVDNNNELLFNIHTPDVVECCKKLILLSFHKELSMW